MHFLKPLFPLQNHQWHCSTTICDTSIRLTCLVLLRVEFCTVCISVFKKVFLCFILLLYYYTEMLCAGCGSCQCRSKSNVVEQNVQNFYNFSATLLILRTMASSVQNSVQAEF